MITPDGATLIVGETIGGRYTAFDIGDDGSLSNKRSWAQLDGSDGETLYMLTSPDFRPRAVEGKGLGSILTTMVEAPNAGMPLGNPALSLPTICRLGPQTKECDREIETIFCKARQPERRIRRA